VVSRTSATSPTRLVPKPGRLLRADLDEIIPCWRCSSPHLVRTADTADRALGHRWVPPREDTVQGAENTKGRFGDVLGRRPKSSLHEFVEPVARGIDQVTGCRPGA
jgi:hypothetical protein